MIHSITFQKRSIQSLNLSKQMKDQKWKYNCDPLSEIAAQNTETHQKKTTKCKDSENEFMTTFARQK